jgi:hypothetical protein
VKQGKACYGESFGLNFSAHGQWQDDQTREKEFFPLGYYFYFNISICDIAKNRIE